MTLVGDIGEAAPAIRNLLVLGKRVGDQRELLRIVLERVRERGRRRLALCSGAVLKQIERGLDRERFSRDFEAQICNRRVEMPVPRRVSGHRFFVK